LTAYGTGAFAAAYAYVVENRMSVAAGTGTVQTLFGYDSGNQRVYQGTYNTSAGTYSNEQIYFYGADGKKLGCWLLTNSGSGYTLTATATNVWFAGRLLTPEDRAQSRGKYFPFGEERTNAIPANPTNDQEKFATYTRDSATGLDYAYQRYYNSQVSRFHTPDPDASSPRLKRPQSWNRYAYVEGQTVNAFDPDGRKLLIIGQDCQSFDVFEEFEIFCFDVTVDVEAPFYPAPPPRGGGGGAFKYSVTGYSRSGPKETQIANVLKDILNDILSTKNPCSSWLTGQFPAADLITAILGSGPTDYSFGYGVINSNTTAAFVGNVNSDGSPVAGLPKDSTITVNTNGAFFNSGYTVSGGGVRYPGGTLKAQAFILIHELAHEVEAAGFQPDAGSSTAEASNNNLVQKNCGKQIAALQ
jgi:RHS repeat-associated protein